jgi:hypothetical protein
MLGWAGPRSAGATVRHGCLHTGHVHAPKGQSRGQCASPPDPMAPPANPSKPCGAVGGLGCSAEQFKKSEWGGEAKAEPSYDHVACLLNFGADLETLQRRNSGPTPCCTAGGGADSGYTVHTATGALRAHKHTNLPVKAA